MAQILIVEDEEVINELIKRNLLLVGHTCHSAFDGKEALKCLANQKYDLMILDIMLPKEDGFQVMRQAKEQPTIFLTARDSLQDRIKGFSLGADDYITKPFEMLEMLARVEAVLRRTQTCAHIFELDDVQINFDSRQVFRKQEQLDLTPKEYELLETLVKNWNLALSRERLLELVWGYDYEGETRTVDVHIQKLRKKPAGKAALKPYIRWDTGWRQRHERAYILCNISVVSVSHLHMYAVPVRHNAAGNCGADKKAVPEMDITESLEDWMHRNHTMLLIGAVVSFIMAVSLLILLDRIFLPLIQITGLSQRIAEGDYRERLPVHGTDEIGQMASSFNHMAEEIENKVTELAAAAENRQRFVDNFAHELRTPLTAIYGYAQYMQSAALNQEDAQFALDTILEESRRMQQMANQLMELSGLRNGEIKMEPQNLSKILDFVSRTVGHKLTENHIELHITSGVDTVVGDMVLLQSLLVNLIDNAVKASSAGEVITIKSFYEGEKAVITVSDQGKGMEPEELERITEPYYRVDKARNRKEGGAGLGLAICSQIVKCHGARLTFHSEPGRGTTATVIFTTP